MNKHLFFFHQIKLTVYGISGQDGRLAEKHAHIESEIELERKDMKNHYLTAKNAWVQQLKENLTVIIIKYVPMKQVSYI